MRRIISDETCVCVISFVNSWKLHFFCEGCTMVKIYMRSPYRASAPVLTKSCCKVNFLGLATQKMQTGQTLAPKMCGKMRSVYVKKTK